MSEKMSVDRRDFLKSAAITGAAALVPGTAAVAAQSATPAAPALATAPTPPREADPSGEVEVFTTDRPGGDFMVDVIKALNFEYVASQSRLELPRHPRVDHQLRRQHRRRSSSPAATRSRRWRWRTATSRSKASRWPCCAHGTVGMQHAAMAIYNAYCDRVPVYILAGNTLDATHAPAGRRVGAQRAGRGGDGSRLHQVGRHAGLAAALRRVGGARLQDRDDAADDAGAARASTADCRKIRSRPRSASQPAHPEAHASPRRRRATPARSPKRRACSSTPRTRSSSPTARRARRPACTLLVELAETLQAPVVDQGGRMNFPSRHPLNQSDSARQLVADADVILGLELTDFWGTVSTVRDELHRTSRSFVEAGHEADQHHRARSRDEGRTTRTSSATRKSTSRWRPTPKRRCRR